MKGHFQNKFFHTKKTKIAFLINHKLGTVLRFTQMLHIRIYG